MENWELEKEPKGSRKLNLAVCGTCGEFVVVQFEASGAPWGFGGLGERR